MTRCEVSEPIARAVASAKSSFWLRAGQDRPQSAEAIIEERGDAGNFSQVAMGEQVYGIVDLRNGADHPYEVLIQIGERRGQECQPTARFHGEQHARNIARLP